ncbi:MAG: hypothetical protein Q7Q71_03410 [Verrucomicrobiota bacterium JB023]|nr:hypothetical protein [Verrucomicrobiota bacterium JB023]
MNPTATSDADDAFFEDLFAEAGWNEIAQAPADERRVDEITRRAIAETVMKESTSFVFLGFTSALTGFFDALFGCVSSSNEDYKP